VQLFDWNEVNFAIAGGSSKRLKVQFRITWNNSHADAVPITLGDQCLEELPGWQADLDGNGFSRKVLGVHFILAQFVADPDLIQKTSGVGLLCHYTPGWIT
jgi:hypothetical protein